MRKRMRTNLQQEVVSQVNLLLSALHGDDPLVHRVGFLYRDGALGGFPDTTDPLPTWSYDGTCQTFRDHNLKTILDTTI